MAADDEFVPDEIEEDCTECHKALAAVDALLKPAMAVSKSKLEEKVVMLSKFRFCLNLIRHYIRMCICTVLMFYKMLYCYS